MINLKIDALHLWNIALAGTACGNLLNLIEDAYDYPESKVSIERRSYLETVKQDFTENAPDVEPASGTVTKEADAAEMCSAAPPTKSRKKSYQGPDKCKLTQDTPMSPSATVRLHQTGVAKSQVSKRKGEDGQSIYRCNISGCEYIMAQFAQACTHMHYKHPGVCVQCRLCEKRSFRSVNIKNHC